jgi:hypothetical protein
MGSQPWTRLQVYGRLREADQRWKIIHNEGRPRSPSRITEFRRRSVDIAFRRYTSESAGSGF